MLEDLSIFMAVVNAGSFRLAADQLATSAATITRRVQTLESQLNCQLLIRSSKKIVLTEAGERLYQENVDLIQRVHWQLKHFQSDMTEIAGRIRLLAPNNLSRSLLAPMLQQFMVNHPNCDIAMYTGADIEALAERRADLAIRVEPQADTNLRYRKLITLRTVLVAPPKYAKQLPAKVDAEAIARRITVSGLKEDYIELQKATDNSVTRLAISPRFFVNDLALALETLQHCPGLMLCPESELANIIQRGELVHVYPEWQGRPRAVCVLWNAQNFLLPRSRALIDHLVSCFSELQNTWRGG